MRVDSDVVTLLLALREGDIQTNQLNKQLEELPQRAVIVDCRKKKQALQERLDALHRMKEASEASIASIEQEDAQLLEKQQRLQQEIDQFKGDFRSVEARTKDLEGAAKRRSVLEEKLETALIELDKIDAVLRQATDMFTALDKQEHAATVEFVEQGTRLKEQVARIQNERALIMQRVPADVMNEYQKVAARAHGVAISRLIDGACGSCRSVIDSGRLAMLKREGNVVVCPHCKRLLVLDN